MLFLNHHISCGGSQVLQHFEAGCSLSGCLTDLELFFGGGRMGGEVVKKG